MSGSDFRAVDRRLRNMNYVEEIERKFADMVHVGCKKRVNSKIERLVSGGSDKLQVISDFDRTISRSEYNDEPTISTVRIFETSDCWSEAYRQKATAVYNKYHPIENDTQMSIAQKLPVVEEWWRKSEQLLKGLCCRYEDIEKSTEKANVKLRDGSAEAFMKLRDQHIPLVIVSAGIGDIIELILERENLLTSNVTIVSNFLKFTENKINGTLTIQGYKETQLVHIFNKNEHPYIHASKNNSGTRIGDRCNVILLGDSLGDANMDSGILYNTVLRIGFLNKNLMDDRDGFLQQYKNVFDIVLVQDQTMGLLNYLLDKITEGRSTSTSVHNNRKYKDEV